MTHQDNVAAVRAACIAANPEITELKFGCIVSVRGFQRNAVVVGSDHSDNFCLGYTDNGQRCETWMSGSRLKDEEKILGRDATLPDVLLALAWHGKKFVVLQAVNVAEVYIAKQRVKKLNALCLWNLRLPPLRPVRGDS